MNSRRYTVGRTRFQHYYPTDYRAELPAFAIPNAILQATSLTLVKVLAQVAVLATALILLKYDVPASTRGTLNNQQDFATIEYLNPVQMPNKTLEERVTQRQPARVNGQNYLADLLRNIERSHQSHQLILITQDSIDSWPNKTNRQTAALKLNARRPYSEGQANHNLINNLPSTLKRKTDGDNHGSRQDLLQASINQASEQSMMLGHHPTQSLTSSINNDAIYGLFVNGSMGKDHGLAIIPVELSKRRFVGEFIDSLRYQLADIGWSTLVVFITAEASTEKNHVLSLVYRYALSLNYRQLLTISTGDLQHEVESSFLNKVLPKSMNNPLHHAFNHVIDHQKTTATKNILFIGINPILKTASQKYTDMQPSNGQFNIEYRYLLTENSEFSSSYIGKISPSIKRLKPVNTQYIHSNDDDRQLLRRITGWVKRMK